HGRRRSLAGPEPLSVQGPGWGAERSWPDLYEIILTHSLDRRRALESVETRRGNGFALRLSFIEGIPIVASFRDPEVRCDAWPDRSCRFTGRPPTLRRGRGRDLGNSRRRHLSELEQHPVPGRHECQERRRLDAFDERRDDTAGRRGPGAHPRRLRGH